jgi:peptidoglycan/xylan/chitin deacetylase (PgdA/CDA1 family)
MKKYVLAALAAVFCVQMAGALEPGTFVASGPHDKKVVAISFDDGPGGDTDKILALLRQHRARATFFMLGQDAATIPATAKMVAEQGHEVGSHLYSHPNFYAYKKPDFEDFFRREIDRSEKVFTNIFGKKPSLMRIPHGYVRSWVRTIAREHNYVLVNWTFGCDWEKMTQEQLADAYIKHITPGAIFLMHDGGKTRPRTVYALGKLLEALEAKGYSVVPVGEIIDMQGTGTVKKVN